MGREYSVLYLRLETTLSGALTSPDAAAALRAQAEPRPIHRWDNVTLTVSTQCKKHKELLSAFICVYPRFRIVCAESEYLHDQILPFLNLMPSWITWAITVDLSFQIYSLIGTCAKRPFEQQTFFFFGAGKASVSLVTLTMASCSLVSSRTFMSKCHQLHLDF